ncbi:MAG: hypothetical protein ACRDRL_20370 [Sciscionella sp.]
MPWRSDLGTRLLERFALAVFVFFGAWIIFVTLGYSNGHRIVHDYQVPTCVVGAAPTPGCYDGG